MPATHTQQKLTQVTPLGTKVTVKAHLLLSHHIFAHQVIEEFVTPKVVPQQVSLKIFNPDLQGLQVTATWSEIIVAVQLLDSFFVITVLTSDVHICVRATIKFPS